ncbi:TetR/AcrR family transcriptional regulator [Nocardia sp. NPDC050630]|uniref:TetR/AcrR family transcriptional regulator n=1 Tax=Nocardia sp. NPDC050630 TaxID=3364321 RepID=UPI00379AF0F2
MPRLPPVTTTTLPSNSIVTSLISVEPASGSLFRRNVSNILSARYIIISRKVTSPGGTMAGAATPRATGAKGDIADSVRSGDTRDRIIALATELFARQGYAATGVAQLGRAAGIGAGALYHHIGSKEELLFTICRAHIARVLRIGTDLLKSDLTATEKLHELAREHMRQVADHRLELRVTLREIDSLTGHRRRDLQRLRDEVEQVWTDIVEIGVRSGELPRMDPLFVKVVLGALNYAVLWYHSDGPATPEEAGDRIVRMLLNGQGT